MATSRGQTRELAGKTGGPSRTYEYREGDRVFRAEWDPRETDMVLAANFDSWSEPTEPIDAAARERIFDGLWAIAGVTAIFDESHASTRCALPVRWDRGDDGFLLDVNDGGQLDYMELGRALRLPFRRAAGESYVALVTWPDMLRWSEPDAPVVPGYAARILLRIRGAKASDMRVGGHLPWKLVVADRAPRR